MESVAGPSGVDPVTWTVCPSTVTAVIGIDSVTFVETVPPYSEPLRVIVIVPVTGDPSTVVVKSKAPTGSTAVERAWPVAHAATTMINASPANVLMGPFLLSGPVPLQPQRGFITPGQHRRRAGRAASFNLPRGVVAVRGGVWTMNG